MIEKEKLVILNDEKAVTLKKPSEIHTTTNGNKDAIKIPTASDKFVIW